MDERIETTADVAVPAAGPDLSTATELRPAAAPRSTSVANPRRTRLGGRAA